MPSATHAVRRAHAGDAGAITHILATGFREDPPLAWILSDPDDRERLSPAFFKPFVDMVLTDGHANIAADLSGAALWLDVDVEAFPRPQPFGPTPLAADDAEDVDVFRRLFVEGLGSEYAKRFFVLDELFSANHPCSARDWRRSTTERSPAYVEASSPRNAHSMPDIGSNRWVHPSPYRTAPSLYPMWCPATIGSPVTAA